MCVYVCVCGVCVCMCVFLSLCVVRGCENGCVCVSVIV